jgi:antitoxin component of MazEF toxin-antitoxin module
MNTASVEVEVLVSPNGDLVVPAEAVRQLALTPGQRVQVTVESPPRRRSTYGILAGRVRDVSAEDIAEVRREIWGDLAEGE